MTAFSDELVEQATVIDEIIFRLEYDGDNLDFLDLIMEWQKFMNLITYLK